LRPYEMMIILAPDIPEEELDPSIDTIESYITNVNGNVVVVSQDSPWGRRRLAYPIRHQGRDVRDGFYTLWYFDAEPNSIVDIEREIRLNDRIIRHLIIALDEQVTVIPPEQRAAERAEGMEGDTAAATAAAPEATAADAPATDAAPASAEPAEAAPAEAEAAEADTSAASAAVPEAAEAAAPADAGDKSTKE